MKNSFFIFVLFAFILSANAQDQIETPSSTILIYNNPAFNYFYVELKGDKMQNTDDAAVLNIDGKLIKVITVRDNKFLDTNPADMNFQAIMAKYVNWEIDFFRMKGMTVKGTAEFLKTEKGNDVLFWAYDIPAENGTISKKITAGTNAQKQLYALTKVKDYVVGFYIPLSDINKFDEVRNYMIKSVDGIVPSKEEIEPDDLSKKLNK